MKRSRISAPQLRTVRHPMAHRVRLEQLESRCVLSANLVATSASLVDASGIALSKANIGEQVFARLSFQVTDLPFGATYQIAYSLDGVTHLSDALDFKAGVPGTWSGTWRLGDGWFASPGSHVMEITIDSANTVAESNEADNVFAFTFAPQPPSDLPSKFVLPIGGEQGMDWQIGNYVDVNVLPGPDNVSDFRGGHYTYDGHDAWDIGIASFAAMDHGVPVFAAAPGVVVEVQDGEFDRWTAWQTPAPPANHVIVDHGNGWRTLYWHLRLSSISVRLNQTVAAGEFLGYVGSSGYSTGPHLHFGVQHRGASVETAYAPAEYWITPPIYTGDVLPSILDYGVSNYDVGEDLTQSERPAELSAFSTASAQNSTTWAHFSGIRKGDSISFRWYRPDDTLYAQDGLVANNDSADPTFYYGTILPSPPDVGVWWARWFVNGNLLAERPFNVTAAGSSSVQVQLSSTIVADGRTTPLRLGNVALGDAAPSVHFTIENKGPATLTASVASLPAGVELEGGFPESIPPHESRTFSLRLNTSAPRDIRGNVVLSTNDPNAQVYSFAVSGTVTGPQLEVRLQNGGVLLNGQSSIDFGTLVAGQRDPSREIVLRNTGSESLNLSDWEMSDSGFAFDGLPPDSLEPGQSATLRVQMNASTPGHKSSQVSFRTNSLPLFRIELNGVVTAVPDTTDADFHILALIYRNATIGGTPSTMDDATIKAVTEGVQAQVPTLVNQLTGGQVQVRVHVEVVDRALATIKSEDDGTYGGARDQDIAPELDRLTRPGWYDDIYVFHPFFTATIGPAWSGNSPARDGMRVATLNFSRPGGVLQSNDVPGMIHEWLHGLDGQYFEERHVPRPHYSDGGDLWLHSTNKYGYNAPLESRPEWAAWYGDYLTDGIRDINQNGLNTGYGLGPDAWAYGVPRNDQPYVPGSPLELPDKNTTTTQYVSDLYWASSQGEWLPARRDRTVNDRSIEINGVRYAKGVGVHANSEIIINLRGAADRFQSAIGVDDDVPATNGSVVFKVFGDGGLLYRSGVMTGAMSALPIDVPVTGVQQLRLVVENAGDGNNSDNASWADARLTPFAGVFASDLAWRTSTVVGNTIYLSDTNWTSSHTDFDSIRRDAPLAGGPITIGGVAFGKGVSAHANSQIVVPLAGQATRFQSFIGVDDDALAQNGSVEFKVFGDGAILYQSGVVTGAMDAAQIDVNVTGVQELRLVVEDGGDGINFDHAAWADARFTFPSGSFPKDIGWTSTYLTLDKSTSRETISVGDTFYGKGIGMPPNAEIAIALGEQFSTFRSLIGIDDQVGDAGSVRFKVIVDGQVAYTSPRVTGAHTAIPVEVNVTGATEVRLQVLDDGDGSAFDHAVWALPYFTRAIAPSPELNLIGKGLSIQSADSSPSQLDGTDFGSVTQGGATVSRTFRVQNDGTATLNLTGLSVPAGFTVTNPLEPSLAPGAFDDIVVRLETSAVGTKSGEIQIFSNDGDESPFNFSITGIVVQPQLAEIIVFSYTDGLEVSDGDNTPSLANGTNFGSVTQGQLGPTTRFQVRNTGNATLALSNLTVPAGFTIVEPLVGSLGPGGIGDFTVQLDTSSPGTKSGEITFNTNDADENLFNFAITGNVTQPQLPEIIVFSYTNGEEVPDGDNTPRLADGTDFGSVTQGQAGPTTRFQVRNTGTSTLTLTNFTLPAGFLLFEPLVTSLGPGGINDFTVQLDTSSPGTKSGQITFNTNDADENPFNFAITGNVTPQEVTAPPEMPDLAAASDSGLSDSDNLTNINNAPGGSPLTLVVPGTIPGAWVSLIVNGSFLMAKWADSGSSTSFSLPNEFDDGVYTFTAQQFQPDKLVSFPSPPLLVTIDTALPGATINTLPAVVAGATSYEFTVTYTDNSAIDVATIDSNDVRVIRQTGGIALPVEVVSNSIVNVAGGVRATYRATPPGGVWDFVDNDTYTVHVQSGQVADTGGNVVAEKQATFQVDFTNQRTPPPGLPDLAASSDTGILNSDNITNINSQPATPIEIVVPNTVPGAKVSLYSFGDLLTSKTADSSGSTTFFLHVFFTDYTYIFTARQRSPGELISVSSPELAITFDTTPPAPPVLSLDHILATRPNGLLFSDDPRTQLIVLAPVGGFVLDEVYYLSPENNFSNAAPATIISQGTFGYFPFAPDPVQFALDISQAFPQTRDGFYFTYYSKVIDIAGNPSEVSSLTIARDATPPTAQPVTPPDITIAGQSKVAFSVTYGDTALTDLNGFDFPPLFNRMLTGLAGVNSSTIGTQDVQLVGPTGNRRTAQRLSTIPTVDGRGYVVTYEFDAPSGTWTSADKGEYRIDVLADQINDIAGNAAPSTFVTFRVDVPPPDDPPTAIISSEATVNAAGGMAYVIRVRYEDDNQIDLSTIGAGDVVVDGPAWSVNAELVSVESEGSGEARTAIYRLTPPRDGAWAPADNGHFIVRVLEGAVADSISQGVEETVRALEVRIPEALAPIFIDNPSFETPGVSDGEFKHTEVTGWVISDSADGVQNWTDLQFAGASSSSGPSVVPHGQNAAVSRGRNGSYFSQPLPASRLQPLTRYLLNVEVGHQLDAGFGNYKLQLFAGSERLAEVDTPVRPEAGDFRTATLDFSTGLTHEHLWEPLEIRLFAYDLPNESAQVNFDLVRLWKQNLDHTVPTAKFEPFPSLLAGTSEYEFAVRFSDDAAIDVSSLGDDIFVTGPNDYAQVARLVSIGPKGNGPERTVTYGITAPDGTWNADDEGAYQFTVAAYTVFDHAGNPVELKSIEWLAEVAEPEIDVELPGGVLIASGGPPTALADRIQGASGAQEIVIFNRGAGSLSVSTVSATGDFTVSSQPPASIATGASATFIVSMDTTSPGTKAGSIHIANSDSNESPYEIALTGQVQPLIPSGLHIANFQATPSGFVVELNTSIDVASFNLYETEQGGQGPADVSLLGDATGEVAGSIIVASDRRSFTFIKTGVPLLPDNYTVRIRSGFTGLRSAALELLDGDANGTVGDDFVGGFAVSPPPANAAIVSIADFSRGPGQDVDVPATAAGIPIWFENATGIEAGVLELRYDPALLSVTNVTRGPDAPIGLNVVPNLNVPGLLTIAFAAPHALPSGHLRLLSIQARVPSSAPYKMTQILHLQNVSLQQGSVPVISDDGVALAAYLGDTLGRGGEYDPLQAQRILRVVVGLDSGFAAYPLVDPFVLASMSQGDSAGIVDPLDATRVLQEVTGIDRLEIPPLPDPPAKVTAGPDPHVWIARDLVAQANDRISVPVQFERLPGEEDVDFDLVSIQIRVRFPSDLLSLSPEDLQPGTLTATGWTIGQPNVLPDVASGISEARWVAIRTTPVNPDRGTLMVLNFTVLPGVSGVADLDLRATGTSLRSNTTGDFLVLMPEIQDGPDDADGQIVVGAQNLGVVRSERIDSIPPSEHTRVFGLEAGLDGILTVEALWPAGVGEVHLTILDGSLVEIGHVDGASGTLRLDRTATFGEQFYIRLDASANEVSLRITNAVTVSSEDVHVFGTSAADQFEFVGDIPYRFSVNGAEYQFPMPTPASLSIDGGSGNDMIHVTGSPGNDVLEASPGSAEWSGGGRTLQTQSIEHLSAIGGGGFDRALVRDSAGDDTFDTGSGVTELHGSDYSIVLDDMDIVTAMASTGNDSAHFTSSAGEDQFVGRPEAAQMAGIGFLRQARGFDSALFVGSSETDIAVLYDSAGNDELVASPGSARLFGSGFDLQVNGVPKIRVLASSGYDRAALGASEDTDQFLLTPEYSQVSAGNRVFYAKGFDEYRASTSDNEDQLSLYGSTFADSLVATPNRIILASRASFLSADGFATTRAFGSGGDDHAFVAGGGNESFLGLPEYGRFQESSSVSHFFNFSQVRVVSGGGDSQATMFDSTGDDQLTLEGRDALLEGADWSMLMEGFVRVVANSTSGHDTKKERAHSFLFEQAGDWFDEMF